MGGASKPRKRVNSTSVDQLPSSTDVAGKQNPDQPLTEQQRLFVNYLVHDRMTQTAAARLAGYNNPAVSAVQMMKNPKIMKALSIEREEYAKASGVTKKKVIDGFLEAIDMAKIKADPIAMVSGWREVGKMCGFYEPQKREVSISVNGQVMLQRVQSMSDEELLQLVEHEPEALAGEFSVVPEEDGQD